MCSCIQSFNGCCVFRYGDLRGQLDVLVEQYHATNAQLVALGESTAAMAASLRATLDALLATQQLQPTGGGGGGAGEKTAAAARGRSGSLWPVGWLWNQEGMGLGGGGGGVGSVFGLVAAGCVMGVAAVGLASLLAGKHRGSGGSSNQ
jgi:hypothetical protein